MEPSSVAVLFFMTAAGFRNYCLTMCGVVTNNCRDVLALRIPVGSRLSERRGAARSSHETQMKPFLPSRKPFPSSVFELFLLAGDQRATGG
jgi:hypothetical protein